MWVDWSSTSDASDQHAREAGACLLLMLMPAAYAGKGRRWNGTSSSSSGG